jgi:hypothetical protein
MLRRIFASLIILSSIVAEGLAGFSGYSYGYFFSLNSQSDYSQSKNPETYLQATGRDSQYKWLNGLKSFKVSAVSIEKSKLWNRVAVVDFQPHNSFSPSFLSYSVFTGSSVLPHYTISIYGSDVSPPVLG